MRTGSAHSKRDLWATGTTQQNGCCAAGRLRRSIPASPHCLSRLAVPSLAEAVSVLRRLDGAGEAGGKGRKAPAQREVGRLRAHSGRGSVLGKGIGREGGGGPGPAWAGEGRSGEGEACTAGDWALLCEKLGCGALKDEVPAKRKSARVCHCLRNNRDGDGLAVLRVPLFNLTLVL